MNESRGSDRQNSRKLFLWAELHIRQYTRKIIYIVEIFSKNRIRIEIIRVLYSLFR